MIKTAGHTSVFWKYEIIDHDYVFDVAALRAEDYQRWLEDRANDSARSGIYISTYLFVVKGDLCMAKAW